LRGKKNQFGVVKKKLCYPDCFFFNLWVGWAGKYTLGAKFGGPTQRRGRASLGEGGAGENLGPHYEGI
jgi:hypothetical protein